MPRANATTIDHRTQPTAGWEPIPGYILESRVGVGGYGEVWSATAPGGLRKAVKFVFGALGDVGADRELTSLNRVKLLQHPFLLSLERIEVVNEQLVIVSELAQSGLRELHQQYIDNGDTGIPREKLLQHLANAADALDYLRSQSLQHLDVKPENLLLVGGHIKVSDFGLVKDLRDNVSVSLVGGLTPKYSPPELLDNKPHSNSDQYSLAIVYQEMLTGSVPFDGATTAQLAAQHLRYNPNVSPLPPSDRFAVEKALSKNPSERFASCREFVQYLISPPRNASAVIKESQAANSPGESRTEPTEVMDVSVFPEDKTLELASSEAVHVPPPEVESLSNSDAPTLFIGVGGMGADILNKLGPLLRSNQEATFRGPHHQLLLLDTDLETITRISETNDSIDTVPLPLREPEQYRNSPAGGLASISRRWIYNIPRSRKTEGLRALGRLAFLDHSERIMDTIRSKIRRATSPESRGDSVEQDACSGQINVCLLGSINGGTGGGMLLDLGYAVRQILAELCIPDDRVHGFLISSLPASQRARDLAVANGYACLRELKYFTRSDTQYPGEPGLGLAAFHEASTTFPSTYVLHAGNPELPQADYTEKIASYLQLSFASKASPFFDYCRRSDHEECGTQAVRTFGIHSLSQEQDAQFASLARQLGDSVVASWLNGPESQEASNEELQRFFAQASSISEQDTNDLSDFISATLSEPLIRDDLLQQFGEEFHSQPSSFFHGLFAAVLEEPAISLDGVLAVSNSVFTGESIPGRGSQTFDSINTVIPRLTETIAARKGTLLCGEVVKSIAEPHGSVESVKQRAIWMCSELDKMVEALAPAQLAAKNRREQLEEGLANLRRSRRSILRVMQSWKRGLSDRLSEWALAKLEEQFLNAIETILRQMKSKLVELDADIRSFWHELNQMRHCLATPSEDSCSSREILSALGWDDLRKQLDTTFRRRLRTAEGELASELTKGSQSVSFADEILTEAQRLISLARREAQIAALRDSLDSNPALAQTSLLRSTPELNSCGGRSRLLLTTPESQFGSELANQLCNAERSPLVVKTTGYDAHICQEVGDVNIELVSQHTIRHRLDLVEYAKRLKTRTDIQFE